MSEELLNSFDVLDINTKRKQINDELIIIYELIRKYEDFRSIVPITNSIKRYTDFSLTESESLTFLYENVYSIEQELIKLLSREN